MPWGALPLDCGREGVCFFVDGDDGWFANLVLV